MAKTSKKASAKTKGARVNKSAWIRSQPPSLSAKEVVEKAKSESITLSLAQVYTARSTAKRQGVVRRGTSVAVAAVAKRGPGRPKGSGTSSSSSSSGASQISGDLRRQFVTLAVRIGTDEAQRLLDRVIDVETGGG
jgi:hypothetical protein